MFTIRGKIWFCGVLTFHRQCIYSSEKGCTSSKLEGGVRVCGIAVLGYFWCGFAVIFFSKHGNAVFKVQAVRGNFKFYVAVIGEKIVVSR